MEQFYDNLNTMPKDIALQKAQLATIREYPAVFNWAPFILTGDCN
jgi:CHAT domain-containing protein